LGIGGGGLLILLALLSALAGAAAAESPSLHLDPTQGPATVTGRVDQVLRDSLRARTVVLFPLDSLRILEERRDWSPGERTQANVARILSNTHRGAMGWVRVDPLENRFHRIPWWYFWAKRLWTLRGEVFRASPEATVSERVSVQIDLPLGFVGTDAEDTYPASSAEFRTALDSLSRGFAAKAIPVLMGQQKP
jgi:hypothetical protein